MREGGDARCTQLSYSILTSRCQSNAHGHVHPSGMTVPFFTALLHIYYFVLALEKICYPTLEALCISGFSNVMCEHCFGWYKSRFNVKNGIKKLEHVMPKALPEFQVSLNLRPYLRPKLLGSS
jgi:hypothetical protein